MVSDEAVVEQRQVVKLARVENRADVSALVSDVPKVVPKVRERDGHAVPLHP